MNGVSPGGKESLAAEPGVDNGPQIARTKRENETQTGSPGQKRKDTRKEKQLQSRLDISLELLVARHPGMGGSRRVNTAGGEWGQMLILPCGLLDPAVPEPLLVHRSADSSQDSHRWTLRRKAHFVLSGDQSAEEEAFLRDRVVPTPHMSPALTPHYCCALLPWRCGFVIRPLV